MNKPAQIFSILILSVSVSVFAGCGKQETTDTSTNETVPTTSETVVKEGTDQPAALESFHSFSLRNFSEPRERDVIDLGRLCRFDPKCPVDLSPVILSM
jgi:hypothetical protein